MPTIEFTDDQYERFRAILADLEIVYVGEYGTIREEDAVDYLLDTYTPPMALDDGADASADGSAHGSADTSADGTGSQDASAGAPETPETGATDATGEDLTTVSGIGDTKAAALADAGFETVTDLRAATVDALATADGIGEDLAAEIKANLDARDDDGGDGSDEADESDGSDAPGEPGSDGDDDGGDDGAGSATQEDGAARLESMMSLLDEHDGVWRESGGDEPYEVELPDGSVESARTKDHVRQLLFQHYR